MQFEELHQRQSQWTVPDTELRESLRLAVAEVLLPAYRSFIKRFGWVCFSLVYHNDLRIITTKLEPYKVFMTGLIFLRKYVLLLLSSPFDVE